MKGERKYLIILVIAFALYVIIQLLNPKPINWTITLAHEDKNPFGTFVLDEILEDLFPSVNRSYLTLYEQQDTLRNNQLIVTTNFYPDQEDIDVMLNHVYEGGNLLVSSHNFSEIFTDTLNFEVEDYVFDANFQENLANNDSSILHFSNPELGDDGYSFQRNNTYRRFISIDTSRMRVVSVNDLGQPVTVRLPHGKGNLLLNTTPLAFSNIYLLHNNNREFVSKTLSMMPADQIHWAEYYMQGRRESASPLRYILKQPSLAWAYYLLLASLVIYMVIESKRKQRIIPIIKPLRNTTLEFVNTISSLYFKQKNHRSIADKRISYFLDQLRSRYFLPQHLEGQALYEKIAAKSGHSVDEVKKLMNTIMEVRMQKQISEDQLKKINSYIEEFKI